MSEAAHEAVGLSQRIEEALSIKTMFTIKVGGLSIPITETVVVCWIVMGIIILGAFLLTRKMKEVPEGPQVILEYGVDFLNNFLEDQLGHHAKFFASYIGTLALFLVGMNLIGFFSPVPGFGFEPPFVLKPPTRDINVTAPLAIITISLVVISGIAVKRPSGWLKSFVQPVPFMLPFHMIDYVVKPLSLALRLFGNILGGYIIMELIVMNIPLFVPPIASLYLDFFDGLIQVLVFVFLTTVYIHEAVE